MTQASHFQTYLTGNFHNHRLFTKRNLFPNDPLLLQRRQPPPLEKELKSNKGVRDFLWLSAGDCQHALFLL